MMLRPGGALVAAGDAYSGHLHGIPASHADIVGPLCCNCKAAEVAVGQTVPRAPRRLSLVFVQKLCQGAADPLPCRDACGGPAAFSSPRRTVAGDVGVLPSDGTAAVVQLSGCRTGKDFV